MNATIDPDEEAEAIASWEAGDRLAGGRLLAMHAGMIFSIARTFQGRGIEIEDLLQEARAALLRAAQGFDPTRGLKFATYAWSAITNALISYKLSRAPDVHAPRNALRAAAILRRAAARGLPVSAFSAPDAVRSHYDDLASHGYWLAPARRLDAKLSGHDDHATLGDLLPGDVPDPAASAEDSQMLAKVRAAFSGLGPQEQRVLDLRYNEDLTLEEIGAKFNLTRERIRQIEARALGKLRLRVETDPFRPAPTLPSPTGPGEASPAG